MNLPPVITIDGPTASGKGTIAQRVAGALRYHYLDSGALYRLVAWRALTSATEADDVARLAACASTLEPDFVDGRVSVAGADVTEAIRTEEVSRIASQIAVHPPVRQALLDLQRSRRLPPGLVADGRDMGTVVFPDARLKIFLTASLAARSARRYNQLIEKANPAIITTLSQQQVEQEMCLRDQRDAERVASPLAQAKDARTIDSSAMTADQVVALILDWSHERMQHGS